MSSTTLLATDQQRSVLNTLKASYPPQAIAYSPYGHRPAASGLLSLLGFNGEPADPMTGQYLLGNGYRAFHPVLMRFNRPDSLCPFGSGGLNAYAYCQGDPINLKDPSGHNAAWAISRLLSRLKLKNPNEPTWAPEADPAAAHPVVRVERVTRGVQQPAPPWTQQNTPPTFNPPVINTSPEPMHQLAAAATEFSTTLAAARNSPTARARLNPAMMSALLRAEDSNTSPDILTGNNFVTQRRADQRMEGGALRGNTASRNRPRR